VPYVTSGVLTSAFVNSSSSITDIQQNAAGDFAGRIEQTTLAAHLRANQQFSNIIMVSNLADSIYHSWQTTVRKRYSNGLLLNFSYTYGKAIDDMSGDPIGTSYSASTSAAIDSNNLRADRGRADFDQRRTAVLTWIYELPFGKGKHFMTTSNRVVQTLFGGWQLQGFNSNQSGEPFSISSGSKTYQFGSNSRVALTGPTPPSDTLVPGPLGPVFFMSTAGFQLAAAGSTGIGRNTFQGPAFWDSYETTPATRRTRGVRRRSDSTIEGCPRGAFFSTDRSGQYGRPHRRVWSKSARPRSALRLLLSMAALVDALYEVPIGSPDISSITFP
jgi:hypothetical protein